MGKANTHQEHSALPEKPPAFKCNRKGHYSAQCFSKSVAGITEEPADEDGTFVGVVETSVEKSWTATIVVQGKPIIFKLHTSAEVSAISKETYNALHPLALSRLLPHRHSLDQPSRP